MSKMARRTLWSSRSRSKHRGGRQAARVDGLDRGEVRAVAIELREDGLAAAVTEQVVVLVEPERGAEHGVVPDEPDEARLDEVVERVVERPRSASPGLVAAVPRQSVDRSLAKDLRRAVVRGEGWWAVAGEAPRRSRSGQADAGTWPDATDDRLVSASAARVASMVVSMSAEVTP